MKKLSHLGLYVTLLSTTLTLHAASLLNVENSFSVNVLSLSDDIGSNRFSYTEGFLDMPDAAPAFAFGFDAGGALGRISSQGMRGYRHWKIPYRVWPTALRVASNFFYNGHNHGPCIIHHIGRNISFLTNAGVAPATAEKIRIGSNPVTLVATDSDVYTAPQTEAAMLGSFSSMTASSHPVQVMQPSLTNSFMVVAEAGSIADNVPPKISICRLKARIGSLSNCKSSGLDLRQFRQIKSVQVMPSGQVAYVTAVDASTGSTELYYTGLNSDGMPSGTALQRVTFSDGKNRPISYVFGLFGATGHFYGASSENFYRFEVEDDNLGVVSVTELVLAGLPALDLIGQPQAFSAPSTSRLAAAALEDDMQDAMIFKVPESADYEYMVVSPENKQFLCRGTSNSALWTCKKALKAPASISATSSVTDVTYDVYGQLQLSWVFGLSSLAAGYSTTLWGATATVPADFDDSEAEIVTILAPAAQVAAPIAAIANI
ncbi:MAG: hypothetical protein P1U61_04345 [Legionellaceae bacterium]|nr:hypothetical protein [Legionellaceae bacterium]